MPRPFDRGLDYLAPSGGVHLGDVVEVSLGQSREIGIVWGPGDGMIPDARLKSILRKHDVAPMTESMMRFLERASQHTVTSLPMMVRLATRAPGIREPRPRRGLYRFTGQLPERMTPARERVLELCSDLDDEAVSAQFIQGVAQVSAAVVKGLEKSGMLERIWVNKEREYQRLKAIPTEFELSDEQRTASAFLRKKIREKSFCRVLLKGVTGSGKTEVYLEAVSEAFRSGRQVLLLLPEIALTTEFIGRIKDRFGAEPAEWHSGIAGSERRRLWRAAGDGSVQLVVGARSALFLPFRDLGLIIVDEEHDISYKQEDVVLYNARDMAVLRASICDALIVLASATPSLETWNNAREGKYHQLELPTRVRSVQLPEMEVIDLRSEGLERGKWISAAMAHEMRNTLEGGNQAMLFLNRRGYAPLTVCRACGAQFSCPECDARLVQHRFVDQLICHQCGRASPLPTICPDCGAEGQLAAIGPGVERLMEEANNLFPDAPIAVLSSDIGNSPAALAHQLKLVREGHVQIIVGTQIIAKGHNFPFLKLVGVIDADLGLYGCDLRASERTFQLMTQVAGRAGRTHDTGRGIALLQTWQPDHPVIQAIMSGNDEEFWAAEAAERRVAGAPPFGRYAAIILSGPVEKVVQGFGRSMVLDSAEIDEIGARIFGPAPAPVSRIRGHFRYRLLIKASKRAPLPRAIQKWRSKFVQPAQVRVTIDIDPQRFV